MYVSIDNLFPLFSFRVELLPTPFRLPNKPELFTEKSIVVLEFTLTTLDSIIPEPSSTLILPLLPLSFLKFITDLIFSLFASLL